MNEQPQSQCKKNDKQDHKLRWDLLPLADLEEVIKVYNAGAEKYGVNTWQNLPDGYNRYKAAMFRHLVLHEKGEMIDEETGCRHIAQVAWNAIAMLHCALKENEGDDEKFEMDDSHAEPYVIADHLTFTNPITECRYFYNRYVSSPLCMDCPYFDGIDTGNQIVFCKYPKEK